MDACRDRKIEKFDETTPTLVINAGVIGFGFVGEIHVRAIRASGGIVTAIAAKNIEEAQTAASKMGISKAVTIEEMVNDPNIDVVHICTPNIFHAQIAEMVIRAGKHVVCEKPLAVSVDLSIAIIHQSEKLALGSRP
jgi:predicted dehydrogenase